jgi:hypothetical protein
MLQVESYYSTTYRLKASKVYPYSLKMAKTRWQLPKVRVKNLKTFPETPNPGGNLVRINIEKGRFLLGSHMLQVLA